MPSKGAFDVLTMHDSDHMVRRVLDAGACGYLLKSDLTDCHGHLQFSSPTLHFKDFGASLRYISLARVRPNRGAVFPAC